MRGIANCLPLYVLSLRAAGDPVIGSIGVNEVADNLEGDEGRSDPPLHMYVNDTTITSTHTISIGQLHDTGIA